jgi:hypothetical protein
MSKPSMDSKGTSNFSINPVSVPSKPKTELKISRGPVDVNKMNEVK